MRAGLARGLDDAARQKFHVFLKQHSHAALRVVGPDQRRQELRLGRQVVASRAQLDDGLHPPQRKLRPLDLIHEVDRDAVILQVAGDVVQRAQASGHEAPDGRLVHVEALRARHVLHVGVHGGGQSGERHIQRPFRCRALAYALRQPDRLHLTRENQQRVRGIAPEMRSELLAIHARAMLDQVGDAGQGSRRQRGDPSGIGVFGE